MRVESVELGRRLAQRSQSRLDGDQPDDEGGKLSLAANGWSDAQIEQFRSVLRPAGVRVEASEGRLILTRGRSGGAA